MARTADPEKRLELLDQVVDYLGEHGLAQATLRPMASALGVSINRLVHHFGSKEVLLVAALDRALELEMAAQQRWLAAKPGISQVELYRKWWRWMSNPRNLCLVRLGYEAAALESAVTGLPGELRAHQIGVWRLDVEQRLVAGGLDPGRAAVEAGLIKATFSGLVMDLVATGERRRLSVLLNAWLVRLEEQLAVR